MNVPARVAEGPRTGSADEWREIVADFEREGAAAVACCERRGPGPKTLLRWRRRHGCPASAAGMPAKSEQRATSHFARLRFAEREGLEDAALCEAVRRAGEGLIDADLGGGIIKQRITRKGGGRSGGFRTTVLFRQGELAFFVHGFAKSDRDNLRRKELSGLRSLADQYLGLDAAGLAAAQATGTIIEVECNDQAV